MNKKILFNDEAREALFKGVNLLANAVKVTLGPKGKTVVIYKSHDKPIVTKDGVTVAKAIFSDDQFENMGIDLIKQVSELTADNVGDGTSSSAVVTQAIVTEGLKAIKDGHSSVDLKKGIDLAAEMVVKELKKVSKPAKTLKKLTSVATISANGDVELGKLIGGIVHKCGVDSLITIEESNTGKTYSTIKEGINLDRGIMIPGFMTDLDKGIADLYNPFVLLTHDKITNPKNLIDIAKYSEKTNRPILIIAEDVNEAVMEFISLNNRSGACTINIVKTPGFGDNKYNVLSDIALITGAQVVSKAHFDDTKLSIDKLGELNRSFTDKDSTILYPIDGKKEIITAHSKLLKELIVEADKKINNGFEVDNLKNRLATLNSAIGVVYVGGTSDSEINERKDRVDDAVKATQAALEEGIVPGGGITLIKLKKSLEDLTINHEGIAIGVNIVYNSMGTPFNCIIDNAGWDYNLSHEDAKLMNKFNFGLDANTFKIVDMLKYGIIDPTKVVRNVIENSASVAGLILTTECLVGI